MVRGPHKGATKGLILLADRLPPNGLCARSILLLPRFPTMPRKIEPLAPRRPHPRAMNEEPPHQHSDFDRDFWRWQARRELQEAFKALEDGRILFGDWERLFLSAALDHFRDRNFKQSAISAQRILLECERQPFTGRFTQEKSLARLRADYEELARG
jgi:hypothetical protein